MARIISTRLNVNIRNQIRSFSSRFEASDVLNRLEDQSSEPLLAEEHSGSSIRYNVCRDTNASKRKFVFEKTPVISLDQDNRIESSSQEAEEEENPRISVPTSQEKGYRAFDASTTQKNVILPLKMSKLSNPFPDPVKVMPSHTVSDQEKADQAQAECRVPRSISRRMTS
ncbi:unnamed protein product [Acanthoscelides obtectus]|uniref:Uncharacterized protein n=1 Tax=Acanthoscelides obtectus TaxID=200917 RepID=A0A9P0K0F8_ACAOB|nr:unnamed protein product [Acanthoscelides obtectus]CAK1639150.1 hypothetical protein AOBTE_LOCUS11017 [Acanthoscelides obtectus]